MATAQERTQNKIKARALYLKEKKTPEDIAKLLGLDRGTIYRWKKDGDWDKDLVESLQTSEGLKSDLMVQLRAEIEKFARGGGSPDAVAKVWKVIKEIDPTIDRLGTTINVLEDLTSFIGQYYPQLMSDLAEPVERFLQFVREREK